MAGTFTALVLDEADRKVTASIQELDEAALPSGDVTVAIAYSTLNYKDGMILKGIGRLVRDYPHVPGIDFAGTVEASDSPDYKVGDAVLLLGSQDDAAIEFDELTAWFGMSGLDTAMALSDRLPSSYR